ncbi:MAG: SDR family NAD(P)-dependent oxidoreductase [Bacteroidota bacterium]
MATVLISGVSTGIGKATALELLQRGWRVYGSVRRAEDAKELTEAHPDRFHAIIMDVTDAVARASAVAQVEAAGHQLSALVNNAGVAISGPLELLPEAQIRQQFEVNVFGLLGLTQVCLPLLHRAQEAGESPVRIVNVSSVSGYVSSPYTSLYSASKFAVEALTDGLRRELYDFNIDVVSIAPGPVKTPIWQKASDQRDVFTGRYAHVVEKLDPYLENTMKTAIPAEVVALKIADVLEARRPRPDQIVMPKGWMIRLFRLFPKRRVDKLAVKRINSARRY